MRCGLVTGALVIAGVGTAVGRPAVVLLAVVPLAVLATGELTAPGQPQVSVTRDLSTTAPTLGERVAVRVTVENEGPPVSDCLVADTLPDAIGATESPTRCVRLPTGETTVLEYTAVARRGTHEFGDVQVTARGLLDDVTVELPVKTPFRCRPAATPLRLRESVGRNIGDRTETTGGSGIEFHSVREYRPSDPQRRIDWRRFARTRKLTTVEFREETTTQVQILVDARPVCNVRADSVDPSALSYCANAAERLSQGLLRRGTNVGVGLYPDALAAVLPGNGVAHRTAIERLLGGHERFPWGDGEPFETSRSVAAYDGGRATPVAGDAQSGISTPPDGELPPSLWKDVRLLFISPCFDDSAVEFAKAVSDSGGDIGVLAPDIGGETPGAVVERTLRRERLAKLDGTGIPLAEWAVKEPLERPIEEVFGTWT